MKIIFIRHFKTKGNEEKRYVGKTDEDIISSEFSTAYPCAEAVFTSDYKRCIQTAELIYPKSMFFKCKNLNETDFGDFEYKNFEELKNNKDYNLWVLSGGKSGFPNGESLEDFTDRTLKGFFWAVEAAAEKGFSKIAFIVHGGSIMAVLNKLCGGEFYDYHMANGCGYITEYKNGKLRILGEIK